MVKRCFTKYTKTHHTPPRHGAHEVAAGGIRNTG
nr:MAG TPA: hypothetical protein [Caudoviricetes sp.]